MKSLLAIASVFLIISCNSNEPNTEDRKDGFTPTLKSKSDSVYHDVMEGHDVAMAKMSKLGGYQKRVQGKLDSLKSAKKANPKLMTLLSGLKEELDQADYSMNKWMEEFKADSAQADEAARTSYLESERSKVLKVKERILNSLQRADSLFSGN